MEYRIIAIVLTDVLLLAQEPSRRRSRLTRAAWGWQDQAHG